MDGVMLHSSRRPHGGTMSRFQGTAMHKAHADRESAALRMDHPALSEARSVFPSSLLDPGSDGSVLISGINNAKTGSHVTKGPWARFPIFTLTLEERATCPTSCSLWAECYGNSMPMAKRHRHGPALIAALDGDLRALARKNPKGFVVRLHVLGDFYSEEYAWAWMGWLDGIAPLHVFGYTAHPPESPVGNVIGFGNGKWPNRCAIRFSGAPETLPGPMQATTIWRQPEGRTVAEGIICPAQTDATTACGTCGLCWAPAAANKRIVFIGHGRTKRGKDKVPRAPVVATAAAATAPVISAIKPAPAAAPSAAAIEVRIVLACEPRLMGVLERIALALEVRK